MSQLEISTMALTLDRDHQLRPDRLERRRRIHEHLSATSPVPAGALRLAWHVAGGVLRGGWQWLARPENTSAPRVATAAAVQA